MKKNSLLKIISALLVIPAVLLLAACSKSTTTTTTTTTTSATVQTTLPTTNTTTTTTSNAQLTVNTSSSAALGTFLVDGKGMTLYWTTKDAVGVSNITGTTLANWPVFFTVNITLPGGLNASNFGSITRADGTMQTTYKGWPLYYYIGDKAAGDTKGQGLANVWFVVNPTATAPVAPATTTTTTTAATTTTTTTITTTATSTVNPVTINLAAQNVAFNTNSITVAAGASITVNFNNMDSVPHNFAVYTNSTATTIIFQGAVITGPTTTTYKFTAPTTPGTYFFRCDVHPTIMTGTFIVQ